MTAGRAELAARADALRALHRPGHPLLLANIWDAGGARLVQEAGHPAVATSSGAVAESLGYDDHQGAPVEEMFAAAERIGRVVSVPFTVDAEAGYGLPADELVERLLAAGAVGCNLEDTDHATGTLVDTTEQADRLAAVREASARAGVPLVLNARVDVFLHAMTGEHPVAEGELVGPALERARAYLAAGADCVFPILATDRTVVRALITHLSPAPVNLVSIPLAEAAGLGAARVSLATRLWRGQRSWLAERLAEVAPA